MYLKTILFIHQSADLYGSDKTLLYLVDKIRTDFKPIVVVPNTGPLTDVLAEKNIQYIVSPVVKISRSLFTLKGLITLPFNIYKAIKQLNTKIGNQKIDIIHSNTLAVLLGAFYSKKYKIKHIWHVHEIIKKPKIVALIYPHLVNLFSNTVVFNSKASFKQLCDKHVKLTNKSLVIYNGLDRETPILSPKEIGATRNKFFTDVDAKTLIIGLVGRINKIKGQQLLLNAFEKLITKHNNIKLLFVGSTIPSQQNLLSELIDQIEVKKLTKEVYITSFKKNIWGFYDSIDILVVPTIIEESFGLVALEGMLSNKPVVAANHGGLVEIIKDNETGLLFKANNEEDLVLKIETLINNEELRKKLADKANQHALSTFSLKNYIIEFIKLYKQN